MIKLKWIRDGINDIHELYSKQFLKSPKKRLEALEIFDNIHEWIKTMSGDNRYVEEDGVDWNDIIYSIDRTLGFVEMVEWDVPQYNTPQGKGARTQLKINLNAVKDRIEIIRPKWLEY